MWQYRDIGYLDQKPLTEWQTVDEAFIKRNIMGVHRKYNGFTKSQLLDFMRSHPSKEIESMSGFRQYRYCEGN